MGAFSDNAIGFYLEIEASSFNDTLSGAEKAYGRYVKALEQYNDRAFKSASGAFAQIESLIKAAEKLPETAMASMRRASGAMSKALKPFTQKVNLEFTVTSKRALSKVIGEAVTKALGDVRMRLSEGRRMKKIPDIVGRMDIPHLAEGGIVKGPNKAMDSVLAMLKPGELVVPAEVTKALTETAGRLQDKRGRFTSSKEIVQSLVDIGNLTKALKQVKELTDAGLAEPKDIQRYNDGIVLLEESVKQLDERMMNLGYTSKVRLAPAIAEVRGELKEFRTEGTETISVFEKLLRGVLGPARFLALNKALSDISELWGGLKDTGQGVFKTLGGEEIGSAIDNVNKMNAFLGLTREELRAVKNAAFEAGAELGSAASVDQLTASMADLAEQGVRDVKVMQELGTTTTLAAEGMNIAADAANKFGFEATKSLGLSNEQVTGLFANMGKLSDATSGFNVSAQTLFTETAANVTTMGAALRQMSDDDAERTIESFNRLGAVMHTQLIDGAGEIREVFAKAFEGGPENVEAMQQASMLTGRTVEELRSQLQSGDIEGIFDSIATSVKGLSSDQLRALSQQVGVSTGDLQKFGDGIETINTNLVRSDELLVENGAAMAVLKERATNNKTVFQQWATEVGNNVSNFDLFGVKMGEVLDLTKEFNFAQIASILYLGKMGVEAVMTGVKLAKNIGGAVGKVGGQMAGLSSVGGAAGAGGAITGIFTAIAGGLTTLAGGVATLGAVLLSPPGIAFTVSFIAAVLALAAGARIATPALEVFGNVAIAVVGKVVELFGLAVPIFMKVVDVAGMLAAGVMTSALTVLDKLLNADPASLLAVGPGLIGVAAGVVALAGAMTLLGGVQLGNQVLSFFSGGASENPAGFIGSLLDSIESVAKGGSGRVKELTATTNAIGGFVVSYARMMETVRKIPSESFLGGLFGEDSDSMIEKFRPLTAMLDSVFARFAEVTEMTQNPRVQPVAAGDIQSVIAAELAREPGEDLGAKLDQMIDLIAQLVAGQAKGGAAAPEPARDAPRAPRTGSAFTQDLARGDF